jgi:hypothetical protein
MPRHFLALSCFVFILALSGGARGAKSGLETADGLFRDGKFDDAERAYSDLLKQEPKNFHITLRMGTIALFNNRLTEAESKLRQALELQPKDATAKKLLAEAYYRQDDFDHAAVLLRETGQDVAATKLASFHGQRPYAMQLNATPVSVPFAVTDPLPIVRLRVNGGDPVDFIIDTGAPEVTVDRALARERGIQDFGSTTGTFAGARQAPVHHGRLDSLELGGLVVRNIPVGIMDLSGLGRAMFGGRRIGGVIGTVLFYHFRTTLDYPGKRLVLAQRHGAKSPMAGSAHSIPFWLAGDHFMVAWGKVNEAGPVLLFVDTGLAGGALDPGETLLKEAHIQLDQASARQGLGGGGRVRVVPFIVNDLSLGDVHEHRMQGFFSGPLPMEHTQGFRIAGVISHSFFKRYALTFNFDSMTLWLAPMSRARVSSDRGAGAPKSNIAGSFMDSLFTSAE